MFFPYGESLEPFFVKLPECDHSQCNTVLFVTDWVQRQMPWSDHTGQHLNSLYNLPGGEGAGQPRNQIHKSKDDRMLIPANPLGFAKAWFLISLQLPSGASSLLKCMQKVMEED